MDVRTTWKDTLTNWDQPTTLPVTDVWTMKKQFCMSHVTVRPDNLKFCHLRHSFVEPDDYIDTPLSTLLQFIQTVGLLQSQTERDTKQTTDSHSVSTGMAYPFLPLLLHFSSADICPLPTTPCQWFFPNYFSLGCDGPFPGQRFLTLGAPAAP
jgi:hypothetical protein